MDVGTTSSHLALSSPASSLHPAVADAVPASVATQTVMYTYGSESAAGVTGLAPYESLVTQMVPYAPFVQCYACFHALQPADGTAVKRGLCSARYSFFSIFTRLLLAV